MQDIDFLPVRYRQRHVRRQSQPWRIAVVAAFAGLLAAAVLSQHSRKRQAEKELAAIIPQYDLAVGQNRKLAEVHARLNTARANAELFTYLRHPWPRTQLLAALLAPLPEEITFERLQIACEMPPELTPGKRHSRTENEDEKEANDKLPPAARDLKRLRNQSDKARTVVSISGTTSDSAALHRYLGELGGTALISKADLDSIEGAENDRAGVLQFRATLVVRPGYGQPGGPTGPGHNAAAQTHHRGR